VGTLIVGTAGHIDHGKSTLVRALTGTDPDRLKEEKERGITIDLGFAHLDLGGGAVASFIDVPGHEKFVRNMLAGAHGIDAVLLVIAADESVMPQTREHFHICRLLAIPRGAIVLTKCDMADADSIALAEIEARELVAGSFLEGAPVLRVSARTGLGLEALRAELRAMAAMTPARAAGGLVRLPVDRAFVLKGFGTVVTGTLVAGTIAVGDEIEILPSGRRVRVRGLQVHGAATPRVGAGHRAAVNVVGVEVADIERGDVLTRPGTLRATSIIECELSLLAGERPLKDQSRVRVHLASAEVLARVRVLSPPAVVEPGTTRLVQLRLERPAVAGRGDRLVIRSYSPAATVAGAVVVDPLAKRKRRTAEATPVAADAIGAIVTDAGTGGIDIPTLAARLTVPVADLSHALAARGDIVALAGDPSRVISAAALERLAAELRAHLTAFHAANPLKAAIPREELRSRVFLRAAPGAFEHILEGLAAGGEIRVGADGIAQSTHAVRLSPEEDRARAALSEAARAGGWEGVEPSALPARAGLSVPLAERITRVLVTEGELRKIGDTLVHRERVDALKAEVRRRWPSGSRLDVAAVKELTGLSRKYVIPLLEYLDREKVTRRSGADRIVL
jgi:selenocysteine-specific elongation factor